MFNAQQEARAIEFTALLGRVLVATIFLWAGYGKVVGFNFTVGLIAARNIPLPEVAAVICILLEIGGGLMLVAGFKTRWAALAIAGFTLATAIFFHNFWAVAPEQAFNLKLHFLKNLSMLGGILFIVAFGPGARSVDGYLARDNGQIATTGPQG